MPRRRAFCLVENSRGEVLLIQRGYGKEKGKWSLPGGFVDPGERSKHAARRETREETGLAVKVISTVRVEWRQHGQGVRGPGDGRQAAIPAPGVPGREVLRPGQNEER